MGLVADQFQFVGAKVVELLALRINLKCDVYRPTAGLALVDIIDDSNPAVGLHPNRVLHLKFRAGDGHALSPHMSRASHLASKPITKWKRHSRAVTRSRRWQALRFLALQRDRFKCVQCGARGRLEVDHIAPVRDAPELSFVLENLQSLCARCHGAKTRGEVGLPPPNPERKKWQAAVKALCTMSTRKEIPCSNQ